MYERLDFSNTSGHATAFYKSPAGNECAYDPADDGPEVEIIRNIRAMYGWGFINYLSRETY